ncbi:MAG: sodium:solute symporter family protein [Bacteroidetes bacterium]|nr:MAG: sodium:solute symporter family protein [Bacteroidota bacterium]
MTLPLLIAALCYVAALMAFSWYARRTTSRDARGYLFAGGNLSAFLGLFTFAATLFSTFTLLGMPDFFRTHGVGAWLFLGFSDLLMVFGIIWLGLQLRRRRPEGGYQGMARLMITAYRRPLAGWVCLGGAFLFLIPYVAIQIRGVAIFLHGSFPTGLPVWGWAVGMVVLMLVYSETGGLKAIIYSDVLQGILLLTIIWLIGANCLGELGGWQAMFAEVEKVDAALLSTPGPKGLFTPQFMLASFLAIALIPYTQPQVSTRIMIMRSRQALFRMALGVGIFAILVILPTLFLGMYGAVHYAGAETSVFLSGTLVGDQSPVVAALAMIGLIAAAISTADSQLFALGSELKPLLGGSEEDRLRWARLAIALFAGLALAFSLVASDELVLLARTSFAGTALLAPMIFVGLLGRQPPPAWLPGLTLAALLVFLGVSLGYLPGVWLGLRADLWLMGGLSLAALATRPWLGTRAPVEDG